MDIKLPKLGEGADSGVVVNLFVKEGDTIEKGQPIIDLENEKAVASIPATVSGKVTQIYVKNDDKLTVGQKIIGVDEDGKAEDVAPAATEAPAAEPAPKAEPRPQRTAAPAAQVQEEPEPDATKPDVAAAASPTIRRLAADLGIDLARVRGSERGGRIVMADLRNYIQQLQRQAAKAVAPAAKPAPIVVEPVDFAKWGPITITPLSPLRQVIGRRMSESWASVPRVTQFDEADVTSLIALSKKYAEAYASKGTRLTLTGITLKALVAVLQKHPTFNSSLDPSGENLILKSYHHVGIAVDTPAGLIVPVLRDVDKKSLVEISRDLEELAKKARDRKISSDDLKGGSFTVSNQGGIGGGHFTPVVNLPEVAILGMGRGAIKPVHREGRMEFRNLLPLALSYDHRVIDGGQAARFIVDLVKALENFDEALVKV